VFLAYTLRVELKNLWRLLDCLRSWSNRWLWASSLDRYFIFGSPTKNSGVLMCKSTDLASQIGISIDRHLTEIQSSKNFLWSFRFQSIVRKTIIGFLLVGSLAFNIFSYFTSGFDLGVKICDLDLITEVENLSATFEVLKRLNGVYILIFHFAQTRFRLLVKKKFGNCCNRAE
jgi:hypothetical protein